jgi:hypothetical protein
MKFNHKNQKNNSHASEDDAGTSLVSDFCLRYLAK